jgi:hypothetical protein
LQIENRGTSSKSIGYTMSNTYWFVDPTGAPSPANRDSARSLGFAMEYHFEALSSLENADSLEFYLCIHPPARLPRYGPNVVLAIVGDEYHVSHSYFNQILAVLRCYGTRQKYLDGIPVNTLQFVSLVQFLYKSASAWSQRAKAWAAEGAYPGSANSRTLHISLGCYSGYPATIVEPDERKFDFGFLGSIGTSGDVTGLTTLRRMLPPPKIQARREMFRALHQLTVNGAWNGLLEKTATFAESTARTDAFNEVMAQTKISICPRGSNYETYRFYESFRAGCVVICEPLPKTWFYDGHPGLVIRDWAQLPKLVDSLLRDPVRLRILAAAGRKYWREVLSERVLASKIDYFLTNLSPVRQAVASGRPSAGVSLARSMKGSQSGR